MTWRETNKPFTQAAAMVSMMQSDFNSIFDRNKDESAVTVDLKMLRDWMGAAGFISKDLAMIEDMHHALVARLFSKDKEADE